MPFYDIEITKRFEGYEWQNNYKIVCDNLIQADDAAGVFLQFEQKLHFNLVEFIQTKAAQIPDPSRENFISRQVATLGLRIVDRANYGEASRVLYCVLNAAQGFPGRKMYRYVVADGDYQGKGAGAFITNNVLKADFVGYQLDLLNDLGGVGATLMVGEPAREVTQIVLSTVSKLQVDKKWHNRKKSTATQNAAQQGSEA